MTRTPRHNNSLYKQPSANVTKFPLQNKTEKKPDSDIHHPPSRARRACRGVRGRAAANVNEIRSPSSAVVEPVETTTLPTAFGQSRGGLQGGLAGLGWVPRVPRSTPLWPAASTSGLPYSKKPVLSTRLQGGNSLRPPRRQHFAVLLLFVQKHLPPVERF